MNDLQRVKEHAWTLISDLKSNARPIEEIRTEGMALNIILKSEQLEIQRQIVESQLAQSKIKRANLLLEEGDE